MDGSSPVTLQVFIVFVMLSRIMRVGLRLLFDALTNKRDSLDELRRRVTALENRETRR